jgi:phage tail-like protein
MPRRSTDPYLNCRFRLELNQVEVAGFSECTGLNIEAKVFEYKEGGRNETTLKFPENGAYANVVLKRGITTHTDLIAWQLDVVNGTFKTNARSAKKNLAIVLLDEKGANAATVRRWSLIRALPVKWTGPEMKGNASEIAIETLELAHEGIEIS